MAEKLIRLHKDGAFLSVHPTCLAAHQALGWAEAPDQEPGPNDLGLAQSEDKTLADMTLPELKALAAERGVDLGDATKKADIVAALELAAEAGEKPAE